VKPAAFAYAKARSLDDAIRLLGEHEGDAKLLAGGQSLIATLNMRLSQPSLLVDINGVAGLDGVRVDGRHSRDRRDDAPRHAGTLCGHREARATHRQSYAAHRASGDSANRGTIGGSLAYADPAAELPACLVALDGELEIAGAGGKRNVKAGDFFKGLFETALGQHDVLTAIRVPAASSATRVGFAELARRHGDYAMVGLAAAAKQNGKGLSDVRLVYSASVKRRCARARRRRRWRVARLMTP